MSTPAEPAAGDVTAIGTARTPSDPTAINASFGADTYTTAAGDLAEMTVDVEDGPKYLLVGGNRLSDSNRPVGFVDIIEVSGEGSVTLTLNTRVAGTGVGYTSVTSEEGEATSCAVGGCSLTFVDADGDPIANDISELPPETGADGPVRPLVSERYRLALVDDATFTVSENGVVAPAAASARSELVLTDPERRVAEEIEVFTTMPADSESGIEPVGALRSDGLERSAVTKGDRLVIGVEATGIWGALSHIADERNAGRVTPGENVSGTVLADLLATEEGVHLTIEQTNPSRNPTSMRIEPDEFSDATLIFGSASELEAAPDDPTAGHLYLVIDTSDGNAIGDQLDPGDEYRVEFGLEGVDGERYRFADDPADVDASPPFAAASAGDDDVSEQFPYLSTDETGVTVNATFSITERYLRYDHVTDDGEVLVDANGITGTTTLLPATELIAEFAYDGGETPRTSESTVRIADDGNFSVDTGISDLNPGDRLALDLYADAVPYDSRTVVVAADAEDPDRLRLKNTTTNLTVTHGDDLSELSTTIRNVGAVEGREQISLEVSDEEIVVERYVTVAPDNPQNETFSGTTVNLDPGTYSYTLAIDGDEVGGSLTVERDPAVTQIDHENGENGGTTENRTEATIGNKTEIMSENGTKTEGDTETVNRSEGGSGRMTVTESQDGTDATNVSSSDGVDSDAPTDEVPESAAPISLPFGTREAFGGTVLVGTTYILGHWV